MHYAPRRPALLLAAAVLSVAALVASAPAAGAAQPYKLNQYADVDKGGGIHLANTPGGFYMGRLYPGQRFDRHRFRYNSQSGRYYRSGSRYNNTYAWGYAGGRVSHCFWLGPSAEKRNIRVSRFLTRTEGTVANRCSQAQIDFLKGRSGRNIGSHFNCPPNSRATFGAETKLRARAKVWHNLEWFNNYRGGRPRDPVRANGQPIELPRGTKVWYRYTTLDGRYAVVYVNESIGWAFVSTRTVKRVTRYYGAGGSRLRCDQRRS